MTARYNGLADWYDARFVVGAEPHQPGLLELLGPVTGPAWTSAAVPAGTSKPSGRVGAALSGWTVLPISSGWPEPGRTAG